MSKKKQRTYFSNEPRQKNVALEKLNKEAHEAGISYGKLVAQAYAPQIEKRGHIC